ncbi:MAG: iron-sulfur cluster assembly accessory protein [Gammaproteobacteria bacterium]|nr:iron-sulfur cluster assembly accessory protein [Gammaproteobacteria bacterium]
MITVTSEAAKQILAAAEQGGMQNLSLRLAARPLDNGSIEYGMGFDECSEDDLVFNCEGIEVIIHPSHEPLLAEATLDYVELEPGDFRFIFLNPNDPDYVPPGSDQDGCGSGGKSSGCGGCGGGSCG